MADLWQTLHTGDRVQIAHTPTVFSEANYQLLEETRQLYQHLIQSNTVLTVTNVDEQGFPWVKYIWCETGGHEEHHSLMINHEGIELVR